MEKTLRVASRASENFVGRFFDHDYLHPDVPMSKVVSHKHYKNYLAGLENHGKMKILEIGSREVTRTSMARIIISNADYVGFDFYPGPNVDVVGDAHRLSKYFDTEQFDINYSSAVLEHLAMPRVAATEIAKVLKVGGLVFIETHFSWASYERPWRFFQFSDMAPRVLFSPAWVLSV
jgi:hypothetical protein